MSRLLVTDTHLGIYKDKDLFIDTTKRLFMEMIDYCCNNNIKTIYHLGDFFDNKKFIGTKALNTALYIADTLAKFDIKMYICLGNHDLYVDSDYDLIILKIFKNYPCINIITQPTIINDDLLVPWHDVTFKYNTTCKNLFGHMYINGFQMNTSKICSDDRYTTELFKQFNNVFSGHFHTRQFKTIDGVNYYYLGAPYQLNFGDRGNHCGYYELTATDQLKFIEYSAVKFIHVMADDMINQADVEHNIVKLIYSKNYGTKKNGDILEYVMSLNPIKVIPDFSRIITIDEDSGLELTNAIAVKSETEILFDYVNNINLPNIINGDILRSMINQLITEVADDNETSY